MSIPVQRLVIFMIGLLGLSQSPYSQLTPPSNGVERIGTRERVESYKSTFNINPPPPSRLEVVTAFDFTDSVATITTEDHVYRVTAYGDYILACTFDPIGNAAISESEVVIKTPTMLTYISDDANKWVIGTSNLRAEIYKDPYEIRYIFNNDEILAEKGFFMDADRPGVHIEITTEEQIEGTGSRSTDIDRYGQELPFYNQAVYGYDGEQPLLHTNIPLFISSRGHGIYFENPTPTFADIGVADPNRLTYSAVSGPLSYFIIAGPTYDQIMNAYCGLTGYQPLPPRWSLGYIQSRFGYENENQARQVIGDLRIARFPLDALILDLYWFGDPSVMGNLDWDANRFPNPQGMLNDFNNADIKTILIAETYFTEASSNFTFLDAVGYFGQTSNGESYVMDNFWAGPAALLDITQSDARDWFWGRYMPRIEEGVAGWWSDLGEPEIHPEDLVHQGGSAYDIHNIYSLLWAKMIHENYAEFYPDRRLFSLIRSGYAGMQRYSTFPWSGDVARTWSGLQAQIPILLGMSMSGVPYMGSDIGGFTGATNAELFTRWIQHGAFSPTMRAHGVGGITEPVYFDEPYRSINRDYIQLRYDFLPHNYSLSWLNTTTGRPLALPMHYFHPDNTELQNINDQYYWGENIIVAPILEASANSKDVVLPPGNWIDFWNDQIYDGNQTTSISTSIESMPIFIKEGSTLAMSPGLTNTDQFDGSSLTFHYYQHSTDIDHNSTYTYYEDDGYLKDAYTRDAYRTIEVNTEQSMNDLRIQWAPDGPGYDEEPEDRQIEYQVHASWLQVIAAKLDQEDLPLVNTRSEYDATTPAVFQDGNGQILVHFQWDPTGRVLELSGSTTSISNPSIKRFSTYPNPSNGSFEIDLADFPKASRVIIQNVLGHQVYQKEGLSLELVSIETKLNPGTYFLSVYDENSLLGVEKILVK